MKKIMLLLIALGLYGPIQGIAQALLPPLEEMPLSQKAYIQLKNGDKIDGKILNTSSGRGINKWVLRDDTGLKHELKASEIFEFGIYSNDLVKAQYFNESSASIKAMVKTDRSAIKDNDYVVFRNAQLKGGKELLLQLLNPRFDDKIQVYHAVNARKSTALTKGTITLTGEMQRAYLVSKEGSPTFKVKKGSYSKSFKRLFGECPSLLAIRKPKFKDFGKHIYYYSENCGQGEMEHFWEE
ncbi:hypothetical protein [Pararhodonellum marinum]|uniref:hypothetical protein n=1 Tax=Pararhodonellum marinum TaxID=2755358 RepID=UPI00189059D9|nr:hypothetical protein [Pararhodonellum marinum]